MIRVNGHKNIFKAISAFTAGIFLWNQIAWAGDLAAYSVTQTIADQEKEQAAMFAPSYITAQQNIHESIIGQKQDIESFLYTQGSGAGSGDEEADEGLVLKGPIDLSYDYDTMRAMFDAQEEAFRRDGASFTVTTQAGDEVGYRDGAIDRIRLADGTVMRNIVTDGDNNLVDADVLFTDETLQFVRGGRVVKLVKPDGTVFNYNANARVNDIVYPDGTKAICDYEVDTAGKVIETIITDPEKEARYDASGKLKSVVFTSGKRITYTDGFIASITEPGKLKVDFTKEMVGDEVIVRPVSGAVAADVPFSVVKYTKAGVIKEVLKANGDSMSFENGLIASILTGSESTNYTYNISELNNVRNVTVDRLGIKRIYDRYGMLESLTLDDMTRVVYEDGRVSYIEKNDGTKIKNVTFSETGELDGGLISYPDGSMAVYSDGELLNFINAGGDTFDYADGKIRTVTLADGSVYDWYYEGDRIKVFDRSKDEYRWYLNGQLVKVRELSGACLVTEYSYENNNLAKSVISKDGETICTYIYTYENGYTLIHDEGGNIQAYGRDKKLAYTVDSKGRKYSYTYVEGDAAREYIEVRMPDGSTVKYKDVVTELTRADGSVVRDIVYDDNWGVESFVYVKDGVTYTVVGDSPVKAVKTDGTVIEYYASGWVKSVTLPDGNREEYEYGVSKSAELDISDVAAGLGLEIAEVNGTEALGLSTHDDPSVALLLHGGNTGDTAVTFNGNACLSGADRKFGESSFAFDGSGDYVTVPDKDAFDFGSKDFTIDFWINFDELPSGDQMYLLDHYGGSGNDWALFAKNAGGTYAMQFESLGTPVSFSRPFASLEKNKWYHLALVRNGNTWKMFSDGKQMGGDYVESAAVGNYNGPLYIGAKGSGTKYFKGRMDEIRVCNEAKWTGNFTPLASEHTGRVVDKLTASYESGAIELGASGLMGVSWSETAPAGTDVTFEFRTGGSANFNDGTWGAWSAPVTDASGAAINNTAAKYIQYRCALSTIDPSISPKLLLDNGRAFTLNYVAAPESREDAASLVYVKKSDGTLVSGYNVSDFIAPPDVATCGELMSNDLKYIGTPVEITMYDGGVIRDIILNEDRTVKSFSYLKDGISYVIEGGKLSEVLSPNGETRTYYESGLLKSVVAPDGAVKNYEYGVSDRAALDVTEPGADLALAADDNGDVLQLASRVDPSVALLLHMDEASSTKYNVALKDNARVDQTAGKFGSSLVFDGNGDYVTVPHSDSWNFGAGDFTIDFWINFDELPASGSQMYLFDHYQCDGADWALFIKNNSGVYSMQFEALGTSISFSRPFTSLAKNAWRHVALVRKGSAWKMFSDGRQMGADFIDSGAVKNYTGPLYIGEKGSGTKYFKGRLDEIRISRAAKWTTDFTPLSVEHSGMLVKTARAEYVSGVTEINALSVTGLSWSESAPNGTDIVFQVRTGDSADPSDGTWSAWSRGYTAPVNSQLNIGSAKYLQYKAVLSTTDPGSTPGLMFGNGTGVKIDYVRAAEGPDDLDRVAYVKVNGVDSKGAIDRSSLVLGGPDFSVISDSVAGYVLDNAEKNLYFGSNAVITELTEIRSVDGTIAKYRHGEIAGIIRPDGIVIENILFDPETGSRSFSYKKDGVTYRVKNDDIYSALEADGTIVGYYAGGWVKSVQTPDRNVKEYDYGVADAVSFDMSDPAGGLEVVTVNGKNTLQIKTSPDEELSLLLHLNSAGNARAASDSSALGNTVSFYGDARLDTANTKFGSSSIAFDGSGDYALVSDSNAFDFGAGDFTIDFWINFDELPTSDQMYLFDHYGGSGNDWALFAKYAEGSFAMQFESLGTPISFNRPFTSLAKNKWYHFALVRNGGAWRMFCDGKQMGSDYVESAAVGNYNGPLHIGEKGYHGKYFKGKLDEIRISSNARWNADFTPLSGEYGNRVVSDTEASYTSDIIELNAKGITGFSWEEALPAGTTVSLQVRTGSTDDPGDGTWTDWSGPLTKAEARAYRAGEAKYIQYRVTLCTENPYSTPGLIVGDGQGVRIDYTRLPRSSSDIANLTYVNVTENGVTKTYSQNGIAVSALIRDFSYLDGLKDNVLGCRLNDSEKIINIYDKPTSKILRTVSADHSIIYYEDGFAAKVRSRGGELLVRYDYDADKNLLKTEFVEARRQLEAGYEASLGDIRLQKSEALSKLDKSERDARDNIDGEVARVKAEIEAERKRLTAEKAKYDPAVYDLSEFDSVFRQLDGYEADLSAQRVEAYADLERQVTEARAKINADVTQAMNDLLVNDYNKVLSGIVSEESSPVVYFYYRSVLGRDPDQGELEYWLNKAKAELRAVAPGDVTAYIKALPEYAVRVASKAGIISSVRSFFNDYLAATAAGKASHLSSLGLSANDAVDLKQDDIDRILAWLEGQSLHFGDSAFKTVRELLSKAGITKTFDEIGQAAIKVDILTGVITKDSEGDLLISMHAMEKIAKVNGLTLHAERIDFAELKAQAAINSSIILHINGNHYVVLRSINDADGTVTYRDLSVGASGQDMTMSRAEFMEEWAGYVLSANSIQNSQNEKVKYVSAYQAKNIRGAGWWTKFWKGIVTAFQKVIAPIATILTFIPGLQPIGLILHGLNIIIQTVSFVARTGSLMDIVWAGVNAVGSYLGSQVLPAIYDGASKVFGSIANMIPPSIKGAFSSVLTVFNPVVIAVNGIESGVSLALAPVLGDVAAASFATHAIGTVINIGATVAFNSMRLDPMLSGIAGSLLSGLSLGSISTGMDVIACALQTGSILGMETVGKALGIDSNVSHLAAITAGAFVGGVFTGGGKELSYTDLMNDIAPNILSEAAYIGATELGDLLGVDPRVSYLAGIGIRSSLQVGFSAGGGDPG
ncbi:MAG: LamG-like jellyroll fold domain-containing protein, partial [Candidatus Omnitrophota bacterium]